MPRRIQIEKANVEAVRRINAVDPVLVDVLPAGQVIPGMEDRMVLHAGPEVGWTRMCGAQRGAVMGIILFEGWASTPEAAEALAGSGPVALRSNHDHGAVGSMAGTISPSLPVFVVEDRATGARAFSRLVESNQQFGDYHETGISTLLKWQHVYAPALSRGLQSQGGIQLRPIFEQALKMGDELHNRPNAATALLSLELTSRMLRAGVASDLAVDVQQFFCGNPASALGAAMAASKLMVDPIRDLKYSTVVSAMARNGTEFGIRVAGLGDQWFTAPAPRVEGHYLPGFKATDAGLDMGDSVITETAGFGANLIAGAPGILPLVGGSRAQATEWSNQMRTIAAGRSKHYSIPALDGQPAPVGIDIREVVATGFAPIIDTSIAHREPGYGIIGSGMVRAPMECFEKALHAFEAKYAA